MTRKVSVEDLRRFKLTPNLCFGLLRCSLAGATVRESANEKLRYICNLTANLWNGK